MNIYYLMNKEQILLSFYIKEEYGEKTAYEDECFVPSSLLPVGFSDIQSWLERRNFAKHKEHLQKWLKEWQIDHLEGFIRITHGLSLNDSFWVRPEKASLHWSEINLYTNDFSDIVSRTAFETGLHGLKLSSTSPEFTSEGSFAKCWMKEKDGIYLYKKGSDGFANSGLEPYSEYYASQAADILCRESVMYDLFKYKGALVSRCRMFTSEKEGFVPFYRYVSGKSSVRYRDVIELCEKHHCADDFKNMILLDSVIWNPDRHLGNFGFIVDNDTQEILRFAPVFDHNMSLLARAMDQDLQKGFEQYVHVDSRGHKLGGNFLSVGRSMVIKETAEKLRYLTDFNFVPHEKYNLSKSRIAFLNELIQRQAGKLLESQYTASIKMY